MTNDTTHSLTMASLREQLQALFGFRDFLEGQEAVLRSVVKGRDVVVVMPTGAGKSLCYQLPACLLDGVTLVVSPLIALMKDQVDGLVARGLPATFINSSLGLDALRERMAGLRRGAYKLVYVAPERFRNSSFMEAVGAVDVSMIAVDEAHCISQWGHDFRPDYLRLREVVSAFPASRIMALTATATPDVRDDILAQLGLGSAPRTRPKVYVHGFARPNLRLSVVRTGSHRAKMKRVLNALEKHQKGLVYCATRKQVEAVSAQLRQAGRPALFYHAGLSDEERSEVQERYLGGGEPVVVATNAFGMGVDRADIRFVVHWDVPGSVEAYYQEVGRAGRDGEASYCELLFNYADVRTQEFFIDGANPTPQAFQSVWKVVRSSCRQGPVTESLTAWAAQVPEVKNSMMVGTIFGYLERAGLIRRVRRPGQRTLTTYLTEEADLDVLREQFAAMSEKRTRDESRLRAMLRYVDAIGCRHRYLLEYFGEEPPAGDCRACDNCGEVAEGSRREPATEKEWEDIQKVLSCVGRMRGRFGRGRVAQVLVGSKAKPVLDVRLDELSTYGLMKDRGEAYVRALLDQLIRAGCIEVAGTDYPTVALTAVGGAVVRRERAVSLVWPEPAAPASKKVTRKAAVRETAGLPDGRQEVYQALRAWRTEVSRGQKMPAYVVCGDRTLKEIAAVMPGSLADLEALHGMGPIKVARYGNQLLELVDRFREEV